MPNPYTGYGGPGSGPTWATPGQHNDRFSANMLQDSNPLKNLLSVPTGQIFRTGPNRGGAYGEYGNVTNTFQRMSNQIPGSGAKGSFSMPGYNLGPNHQAAVNKQMNQLGSRNYLAHRLSLLRSPVTTAGVNQQLTSQIGAAEQLRDLENLSNTYLNSAFSGRNISLQNIQNILRLFG